MLLTIALILDMIFAEPKWLWRHLPHPAVVMGRGITILERQLNSGTDLRIKGAVALGLLCLAGGLVGAFLSLTSMTECIALTILLAHGSLVKHVGGVALGLHRSTEAGRAQVQKIVGRNTTYLDKYGIARASIESCAENFSDGVVAPIFWYLVAGLPGLVIYKIVNTADSMIGHKTERYQQFGWASARVDDLMNLVPARITGGLICLAGLNFTAFITMLRDARLHRSPNAGWPESAMAGCLGLKLGGPRYYTGEFLVDAPWLNVSGTEFATTDHIYTSIRLINTVWILLVLGAVGFAAF